MVFHRTNSPSRGLPTPPPPGAGVEGVVFLLTFLTTVIGHPHSAKPKYLGSRVGCNSLLQTEGHSLHPRGGWSGHAPHPLVLAPPLGAHLSSEVPANPSTNALLGTTQAAGFLSPPNHIPLLTFLCLRPIQCFRLAFISYCLLALSAWRPLWCFQTGKLAPYRILLRFRSEG